MRKSAAIALLLLLWVGGAKAVPETCYGFLSPSCCCTAGCCYPINAKEVELRADDHWLIKATGEIVPRTGWSADGQYWRCACERRAGEWVPKPEDRTRCLYVPPVGV